MKPILTVKIGSENLKRRTCVCCDEKAYIEVVAGEESLGGRIQTQSLVFCKDHAKKLKMFLPD